MYLKTSYAFGCSDEMVVIVMFWKPLALSVNIYLHGRGCPAGKGLGIEFPLVGYSQHVITLYDVVLRGLYRRHRPICVFIA